MRFREVCLPHLRFDNERGSIRSAATGSRVCDYDRVVSRRRKIHWEQLNGELIRA